MRAFYVMHLIEACNLLNACVFVCAIQAR
jgi:hypothetical protein